MYLGPPWVKKGYALHLVGLSTNIARWETGKDGVHNVAAQVTHSGPNSWKNGVTDSSPHTLLLECFFPWLCQGKYVHERDLFWRDETNVPLDETGTVGWKKSCTTCIRALYKMRWTTNLNWLAGFLDHQQYVWQVTFKRSYTTQN